MGALSPALADSVSARAGPPRAGRRALRALRRSTLATVGLLIIATVVLAALLAPLLAPHDPIEQSLTRANLPPFWQARGSLETPLGTDQFGRDVWSRIVYGARISLFIGVLAALLGAAVGVTTGVSAGYYRGKVDAVVMRIVDLNLAFPLILLALAIAAILGPNERNLVMVMALTTWMIYARVVRGITLSLREREFVQAARAIGATGPRIIVRYLLPNSVAPLVVYATLDLGVIVTAVAGLSFLGFGLQPPEQSWGGLLAEGRGFMAVAPWIATFPGLAIALAVLSFNFIGDGLRDALDPRLRH